MSKTENTAQKRTPQPVTKKGLLQTACILLVLTIILSGVAELLRDKTGDLALLYSYDTNGLPVDVIFAGSSHMNNAVYPLELFDQYGIVSYNNAQSGQILPVSYYSIADVIKKYHPKVVVFDIYMLYYASKAGNITWMHQSLDPIRNPILHARAVVDLLPREDWEEFLLPLTLYHTRWTELRKRDFTAPQDNGARGCSTSFITSEELNELSFSVTPEDVMVQPGDIPVEYLQKIVDLCKKTDTQLLLVTLPYNTSHEAEDANHDTSYDQAYFNWAAQFAVENDLQYINYFHRLDEIDWNFGEDMYNYGHMNYWGGAKITKDIGQYLAQNYDLPDERENPAYEKWASDARAFGRTVQEKIASAEEGTATDAENAENAEDAEDA